MIASKLLDKVVWVTGASSGIGEALCHELAARGASLVLSARRPDVLEKVRSTCENPNRHLVVPFDILAPTTFSAALQTVNDYFGRVDVLVNCAGVSQRGDALQTDLKVDHRLMEVNYFGPIALSKLVLPAMLERREGQIVVISSLMGKIFLPGRSAYAASKHALHGFFNSLRAEVQDRGVHVTIICPGYIRTSAALNALEGNGIPHNRQDNEIAHGMSAEKCAQRIANAIEDRRAEVIIARFERLGVFVNRFVPPLFRWIARSRAKHSSPIVQ